MKWVLIVMVFSGYEAKGVEHRIPEWTTKSYCEEAARRLRDEYPFDVTGWVKVYPQVKAHCEPEPGQPVILPQPR